MEPSFARDHSLVNRLAVGCTSGIFTRDTSPAAGRSCSLRRSAWRDACSSAGLGGRLHHSFELAFRASPSRAVGELRRAAEWGENQ